jgi:hypothetical protein
MLLALIVLAPAALSQPPELIYARDNGDRPCRQHIDPPGPNPGYPFKTGSYDCAYFLSDPAHSPHTIHFFYSFKKSGLAPIPEDLRERIRPSLTLIGPVVSYYDAKFDDAAQFIIMPAWTDRAAQDKSLLGYDWPLAPGSTHGVKCEIEGPEPYCRALLRESGELFIHVTFARRDEPIDQTYAALALFVSDW